MTVDSTGTIRLSEPSWSLSAAWKTRGSMFLNYYGLKEQPFGVTPDPRYLYENPARREALATLIYGIEQSRGFLALVGAPGMGKTTLLFQLLDQLRDSARTAFLFHTQCNSRELFRYLLADLGIEPRDENPDQMHARLNDMLLAEAKAGRHCVVIIDEAQNLDESTLEAVRLLSNFETPRAKLLQIILAGQPRLAEKLASPGLLQLRQRISQLAHLEPFSTAETSEYIEHRLGVAGRKGPPIFAPKALALIASISQGIPRNINTLCFNALSLGYALRKQVIDREVVQEVASDLSLDSFCPPGSLEGRILPSVAQSGPVFSDQHSSVILRAAEAVPYQPNLAPVDSPGRIADKPVVSSPPITPVPDVQGLMVSSYNSRSRYIDWPLRIGVASLVTILVAGLWYFTRIPHDLGTAGNPVGVEVHAQALVRPQDIKPPAMNRPKPAPAGQVGNTDRAQSPPEESKSLAEVAAKLKKRKHLQRSTAGARVESPPTPGELPGSVRVTSNVPGVEIIVDGEANPSWTAPYNFQLWPGTHRIAIRRPGYDRAEQVIRVAAGTEQMVRLSLIETAHAQAIKTRHDAGIGSGEIDIITDPPGLEALIDGTSAGLTPVQYLTKAGQHACKVIPPPGKGGWESPCSLMAGEVLKKKLSW